SAVSGMMMPPLVFCSSSRRLTSTRSCSGRTFILFYLLAGVPGSIGREARNAGVHRSTAREGGRAPLSSPAPRIKGCSEKERSTVRLVERAVAVTMRSAMDETQETADIRFMREALAEADRAAALGEVPVGAVAVRDGQIIARG